MPTYTVVTEDNLLFINCKNIYATQCWTSKISCFMVYPHQILFPNHHGTGTICRASVPSIINPETPAVQKEQQHGHSPEVGTGSETQDHMRPLMSHFAITILFFLLIS